MEISRFPCKRLLRMPGSTTTRGQHVSCDIDTGCVAFCWTENISAPNLSYAAQYLACALPCERFTSALADNPCITRGRYGSLLLHRDGLPPSTSCRSPGAPSTASEPDITRGQDGPRNQNNRLCPKDLPSSPWYAADVGGTVPGKKPHVRHEAEGVHHASRRYGRCLAARRSRATADDARGRTPEHQVRGYGCGHSGRATSGVERIRLCRRSRNVAVEYRYAEGQIDRLPPLPRRRPFSVVKRRPYN